MGQRANYVVVENGQFALWYSHWRANTLETDVFWGPEWALEFIHRQEPTKEWLDDVWCEGAALAAVDGQVRRRQGRRLSVSLAAGERPG